MGETMKEKTKIAVCFWFGKVYPKVLDVVMLIGAILSWIPVPILMYQLVVNKMIALIFVVALCLITGVVTLWLYVVLKKMRGEISKALIDGIEVKAIAYRTNSLGEKVFVLEKDARLTVEFSYGGEQLKITSAKPTLKNVTLGYKAFLPYENKRVRILYSPSQKHVLILGK